MLERPHSFYEFAEFRLDLGQRALLRNEEPVTLTPKVFDTLLLLVQNNGRVLEKDEMMKTLWPESFVEEGNLSQNIFVLRKILGDDRNGHSFIQTIPRRGYKFVAPVRQVDALAAENGLNGTAESRAALEYWGRHSPFRGLQVFEPEDAWLFFGRDADTRELCDRLRRSPVLVVIGNSGSGKSSLVRAGLIPALRQGCFGGEDQPVDTWRIALFRPSGSPFDYLSEILPGALAPQLSSAEQAEFIADCRNKLSDGGDALRNAISALANADGADVSHTRILLVADQFEEIFTLSPNHELRTRYINALLSAGRLDSAVAVHLVLVLRADFYAHCLEYPELSRCLEKNPYNVSRMTPEQLREAIERRLALATAQAEAGLVDTLLADVGAESGNLALLEHALSQLWKRCGGYGCTITNRAYEEIGRLRGALSKHADEVYGDLRDENQRHLARRIFLELVHLGEGAQDTRRRLRKSDLLSLGDPDDVELLLTQLASSRLISTGLESNETFVEVSHEALIREWFALREWLAQNREELGLERRLAQAAQDWQRLNQDPGALLQGVRLAQAKEWLVRRADASAPVRQFVRASIDARSDASQKEREAQAQELTRQLELRRQAEARAEAERQLREQQEIGALQARRGAVRLRWLAGALAALLLVTAGIARFAQRQKVIAEAGVLATQSEQLLANDHGRALNMAIQSWRLARSDEGRLAVAKALPELLLVLKHNGPVGWATFSPDGRRFVTASTDHTAKIWNTADGHLLATLRGHVDEVRFAQFSPDGQRLVTTSNDHLALVWNSADGRLLLSLRGHSDVVWEALFSPDGRRILTCSSDHTARVWDSLDGRLLITLQGHSEKVVGAQFSPDGQRIVTNSNDHTARIWNASDGRLLNTLSGHTAEVSYAEFSRDGQSIGTASCDHTARVWRSSDGQPLAVLQHDGGVNFATFSPDGRQIVTTSTDRTARIWNRDNGNLLAILPHGGTVVYAAFSPDSQNILTSGEDRRAQIWSSATGKLLAVLQHESNVLFADFSPDGRRIVTTSSDSNVRLWNITSGHLVFSLRGHTGTINSAAYSADGQHIVTASDDRTARIWDSADGRPLAILRGHTGEVRCAQFSPDSQSILTTSNDGTARIWNRADGLLRATLQDHAGKVCSEFSPDGRRIVTISENHTARVWSSADGRLLATLQGHSDKVLGAQFSPDGRRIVSFSIDHTARVWNSADGRLLAILRGHTGQVSCARFSPDNLRIVTAGDDHMARVWNSADGSLLATLQGHTDKVSCARFSPDSLHIVTAGDDHLARVWNSADGSLLATLQGHSAEVRGAQFSPDGSRILTFSADETLRIWNSADGGLLSIFHVQADCRCGVMSAQFSPDGQRILAFSLDQSARVWKILTLADIEKILAE